MDDPSKEVVLSKVAVRYWEGVRLREVAKVARHQVDYQVDCQVDYRGDRRGDYRDVSMVDFAGSRQPRHQVEYRVESKGDQNSKSHLTDLVTVYRSRVYQLKAVRLMVCLWMVFQ